MNRKLTDIVRMKSGVFAKSDTNPDVYYIQSTDFDLNKEWVKHLNPVLSRTPKLIKHFLKKGDILFAAKGKEFFAVVYDGSYSPAVASTTFLVLQLTTSEVLPEYLAWYLNHPKIQNVLWTYAGTTAIPSVNIATLQNIDISTPHFVKQTTILDLYFLQKKEKFLQDRILKLKKDYLNELTYKSLQ
ncbi:restriction endonuclease subunit S [Flavobacterium sp. PL12]|uniref:restriction endonuclease subunit S n=1 Tax=Flavobacterium sp. PL12 TaxID=3071718 RepID=UPI00319E84D0